MSVSESWRSQGNERKMEEGAMMDWLLQVVTYNTSSELVSEHWI